MHRSGAIVRVALRSRSLEKVWKTKAPKSYSYAHAFPAANVCQRAFTHTESARHSGLLQRSERCSQTEQQRFYCSSDALPEHYKVTLPALSPTMEKGTLVRWTKEEGDQLNEGDLLAEIETDKATMGFETPEEGYLAKIVLPGGSRDVEVGKLVCIIVENQEDVAAFKTFQPSESDAESSASGDTMESQAASGREYPSHITVTLPALSPTMEKGNIQAWLKQVGDQVVEGDVLAQIETDKAVMDYETPEEGYVAKILVPEGSKDIPLGKLLCILVENEEDIKEFADYLPPVEAPKPAAEAPPTKAPPTPRKAPPPAVKQAPPATAQAPPTPQAPPPSTAAATPKTGRVFATPYAKKLAKERGIDLALVSGSGPEGQVRGSDVENYVPAAAPAAAPETVAPPQPGVSRPAPVVRTEGAGYTDISLSELRQTNALRMVESKTTVPHYYLSVDVCMDKVNQLKSELNDLLAKEDVELSDLDFVIKAASLACKKVPAANSSWQGDFIREFHAVDLNLVVDSEQGFLTPVVFNAERKGLATISQEVRQLTQRAVEGTVTAEEIQGGTFTVADLSQSGVKNSATVIHPPQACLLSMGKSQVWLIPDEDLEKGYRTSDVMSVTLSCDHRVIDGAVGAQWLAEFRKLLEKPQTMLL